MTWYKFTATKEQAFTIDTQYLPMQHAYNSHLYMRDGYTWEFWQIPMNTIPIPATSVYYFKSNHDNFTKNVVRDMPNPELLSDEPDLTGFVCYTGGSNGVSSRND